MNTQELERALAVAADAMRRCDPIYCAVMGVQQVSEQEWDDALAAVEDAIDAAKESA
jgi:hypothetical protein